MLGGSLDLLPAWSQHEAAAQEIEARSAEHLALEHFKAIDVSLHRTSTPREGHTGFDGVVVLVEPCRGLIEMDTLIRVIGS